jgi:nitrogen fixation protein NifU and related proteins
MDADNDELYQEIILEHNRNPRNKGVLNAFTHCGIAKHKLKGDEMKVYLQVQNDRIEGVSFEGEGSAVAVASASLMTVSIVGKKIDEAKRLDAQVRTMLFEKSDVSELGELAAISGIRAYPARIDCALLAWNALGKALCE